MTNPRAFRMNRIPSLARWYFGLRRFEQTANGRRYTRLGVRLFKRTYPPAAT
jgi:hypothetical protein